MSDTPGAVRAFVEEKTIQARSFDQRLPLHVVLASTARAFADAHDAADARRDAVLRQAREALQAEHEAACTPENCMIAAAIAAINVLDT